jgi:hypothetical protein
MESKILQFTQYRLKSTKIYETQPYVMILYEKKVDSKQFHQDQQIEQPPLSSKTDTKIPRHTNMGLDMEMIL